MCVLEGGGDARVRRAGDSGAGLGGAERMLSSLARAAWKVSGLKCPIWSVSFSPELGEG